MTPAEVFQKLKHNIKPQWKTAFLSAFLIGLIIHMPVMLSDIPNHDGLDSMYFDQNMITSGRWFLTIACGFSSYFTIPWVIGLLGLFFLALASVVLTEFLEMQDNVFIILISGLLVSFPALTSTFAYVFTLDGYMLALLLAILSVLLTKKYKYGFVAGAVCLGCSMGIYQAYLPFAILLCLYGILIKIISKESIQEKSKTILRYFSMGVIGAVFYYVMLQILLKIQGKELASYQGINEGIGKVSGEGESILAGLFSSIAYMYRDFFSFTLKGNVLFNSIFSVLAVLFLVGITIFLLLYLCFQRKWWKNPIFFVIIALLVLGLPLATNIILLISPQVTYHLLMRYQWVVYLIIMVAFTDHYAEKGKVELFCKWGVLLAGFVLTFHYGITDNIAYSNLEKRYEKTYAYCLRLLDRIEQTEGYYQGIPIAMVGVVGDDSYPLTDITGSVTSNMIGMNGDILLYTATNYKAFMKNYLGATLNFLDADVMGEIYYSKEYEEMNSFPAADSVKVVNGILYVKTENADRD